MPDPQQLTLAFTSCMSTTAFEPHQPVWSQIANEQPDVLLLLGDSVYNDCPAVPDPAGRDLRDPGYSENLFASHLLGLYQRQMAVPEFAALVARLGPNVHAIWDDHDFLWNDADARMQQMHVGKMVISANLLGCWRDALQGRQSLPRQSEGPEGARIWSHFAERRYDLVRPGYNAVPLLGGRVWLHLTDGRSWRHGPHGQLLGQAQRDAMAQAMHNAPANTLHLVASGSTFRRQVPLQSESWEKYPLDRDWLRGLARQYPVLMLSGDVHHLRWSEHDAGDGQVLYEATASGAAVNFAPWNPQERDTLGQYSEKYGVLSIDLAQEVLEVRLMDHGQPLQPPWRGKLP